MRPVAHKRIAVRRTRRYGASRNPDGARDSVTSHPRLKAKRRRVAAGQGHVVCKCAVRLDADAAAVHFERSTARSRAAPDRRRVLHDERAIERIAKLENERPVGLLDPCSRICAAYACSNQDPSGEDDGSIAIAGS